MNNKTQEEINVGIDTSQSRLDIYVRPNGDYFSKVALVAYMRKQLTILNTMMKNGTHWEEKHA